MIYNVHMLTCGWMFCHFVESKMSKNYISGHIFQISMLLLFDLFRTGITSVTKIFSWGEKTIFKGVVYCPTILLLHIIKG